MPAQVRYDEIPVTIQPAPAGRGGLASAWQRIRLVIQEINYASRRVVEVQAPWSFDQQWYRR